MQLALLSALAVSSFAIWFVTVLSARQDLTVNTPSTTMRHSEEWQIALSWLSRMVDAQVEANTISYSAALRGVADRIELAEQDGRRQSGSDHHRL